MARPREDMAAQEEILDRAVWRKWNKYSWSGLLVVGIGCLMVVTGLLLHTGAYSAEGLLVGFGVIVMLIGVVRISIGFINPLSSIDIHRSRRLPALEPPLSQEDRLLNALEDEGSI